MEEDSVTRAKVVEEILQQYRSQSPVMDSVHDSSGADDTRVDAQLSGITSVSHFSDTFGGYLN